MNHKRYFHMTRYLRKDLNIIKKIISGKQNTNQQIDDIPKISKQLGKKSRTTLRANLSKQSSKKTRISRPEWVTLNKNFNEHYELPTIQEINRINRFFNTSEVRYEWSVNEFGKIPSEIIRTRDKQNNVLPSERRVYSAKTKIPFELINGLPEILFLGRSNAGKSSLLNNICSEFNRSIPIEVARTSKKAGFTKTLNCFNIGKKFRLIDTPGYGHGSTLSQGEVTMSYIEDRRELRRCYILISANHGITPSDLNIIDHLTTLGRPFEIVFTKMDKIIDLPRFQQSLQQNSIRDHSTLPRLIFTNSIPSSKCPKRYGMSYLRFSIMQSCGLI